MLKALRDEMRRRNTIRRLKQEAKIKMCEHMILIIDETSKYLKEDGAEMAFMYPEYMHGFFCIDSIGVKLKLWANEKLWEEPLGKIAKLTTEEQS